MLEVIHDSRDAKAEERKNQILEASAAVFSRKGYHVATMDDIVKESKLSKGAIYWYFKSKKEIFLEILNRYVLSDQDSLLAILADKPTFEARIRALFDWLSQVDALDCKTPNAEERRLVIEFWQQAVTDPEIQISYRKAYDFWFDFGERIINEAVENGEIQATDAATLASLLVAVGDGILCHWLLNINRTSNQKMLDMLYTLLMQSLKKE